MRKVIEGFRGRAMEDERLDDHARSVIIDMLNELEAMVNNEIDGSIALIKRPLSEKLDWYFTYGDNRVLPITEPDEFRDRDAVRMSVVLTPKG